jgi:hypothetical protein
MTTTAAAFDDSLTEDKRRWLADARTARRRPAHRHRPRRRRRHCRGRDLPAGQALSMLGHPARRRPRTGLPAVPARLGKSAILRGLLLHAGRRWAMCVCDPKRPRGRGSCGLPRIPALTGRPSAD